MIRPLSLVLLTCLILAAWAPAASANQTRTQGLAPAPIADLGNSLLERADHAASGVMLAMGGYVERPRQYKQRPPQNRNQWRPYGHGYYGHGYYGHGPGYHPHKNGPHKNGRPPKGPGHK